MISEESSERFYQACGRLGFMVWVRGRYDCRSDDWLGVPVLEVCIVTWGSLLGVFWRGWRLLVLLGRGGVLLVLGGGQGWHVNFSHFLIRLDQERGGRVFFTEFAVAFFYCIEGEVVVFIEELVGS